MENETYVLDLVVVDAAKVTLPDADSGEDLISVHGFYTQPVIISLCYYDITRVMASAGGSYVDALGRRHEMVIFGSIEHATGSRGRDEINGNEQANRLWGEANLTGPGAADTIRGGLGNDTIQGGTGADDLSGDGDDDLLCGGIGRDTILGGDGRDTVEGGTGADLLNGGGGFGDLLSYQTSVTGIQIALTFGSLTTGSGGDAEGDRVQGFTAVLGSDLRDIILDTDKTTLADRGNDNAFSGGAGRDRLILGGGNDTGLGGTGDDVIWGEAGDDLLVGGAGVDHLRGGAEADSLTGGAGADVFEFRLALESTALTAGRDTITDFNSAEVTASTCPPSTRQPTWRALRPSTSSPPPLPALGASFALSHRVPI